MGVLSPAKPKTLTDKVIAGQLQNASAAATSMLCALSQAASNPDLKRMYKTFGQETQLSLEAIQTYIADQGWSKPFGTPEEQLQMALQDADSIIAVQA